MQTSRSRRRTVVTGEVGFQIAPMIDVVFVILVFFMALAAQIQVEQLLQIRLPGTAAGGESPGFVDELILQVDEDGVISLNDEVFDAQAGGTLLELTATLRRLRESSDAARAKLVVTLASHPDSLYERTVVVLDALAAAGVENISFTIEEEP